VHRIFILAFIWGWSFLFIKVAVEGMTPPTVAFARVSLGMVVMVVTLRVRGGRLRAHRHQWRHFAVMGLLWGAAPFTLLAFGEERITSALAAVLNASTPLFTAVATALILGERLRAVNAVGLLLGFAGVAVAAGLGAGDLAATSLTGSAAAMGAGACYGVAFPYARRHLADIDPFVLAAGQLVAASLLSAPVAAATTVAAGINLEPHRILAVVLLGAVGTGYAYVLMYRAIGDVGTTKASTVTYLVPVVAVSVGVLFLREPFHLRLLAGGALTLAGIGLLDERLAARRR
jgi:drug/metabolite transporter (DMT)-like permease